MIWFADVWPIRRKLPICQCGDKCVDKKNIWFLRSHDAVKRTDKQEDRLIKKVTYKVGAKPKPTKNYSMEG